MKHSTTPALTLACLLAALASLTACDAPATTPARTAAVTGSTDPFAMVATIDAVASAPGAPLDNIRSSSALGASERPEDIEAQLRDARPVATGAKVASAR